MTDIYERVLRSYAARNCFLCASHGPCEHREFQVEVAYLEARPVKQAPRRATRPTCARMVETPRAARKQG